VRDLKLRLGVQVRRAEFIVILHDNHRNDRKQRDEDFKR